MLDKTVLLLAASLDNGAANLMDSVMVLNCFVGSVNKRTPDESS